jgi:putative oxidoreductase
MGKSVNGKGGHDFPALLLRGAIGPMLIAHGSNKVFGKGGLDGTTRWFDSLGLKPPWLHARLAAATEFGAGTLLIAGAAHPWPEAAVVGLMTAAAATDHKGKGFFIFKGGWEYTGFIAATATALAALGHGRISLDHLLRRNRSGTKWGVLAATVGVGAGVALLRATYKPDPPAPPAPEVPAPAATDDGARSEEGQPSLTE